MSTRYKDLVEGRIYEVIYITAVDTNDFKGTTGMIVYVAKGHRHHEIKEMRDKKFIVNMKTGVMWLEGSIIEGEFKDLEVEIPATAKDIGD